MEMPLTRKGTFLLVALVATISIGWKLTSDAFHIELPQRVVNLLRLPNAPASIRNIECYSTAITDVSTICAFDISPDEFPTLLTGWAFKERPAHGQSFNFAETRVELGQPFEVATIFSIQPAEFRFGGYVTLVTDASRSRVQAHWFQE